MKFHRRMAIGVMLLVAIVSGPWANAGRLQPPPRSLNSVNPSSEEPEVHWIRKPTSAPQPEAPKAPVPTSLFTAGFQALEARVRAEPETPPEEAEAWIAQTPTPAPSIAAEGPGVPGTTKLAESGMTLAELEEIALTNNPTLVQAGMRVQAAQGKCLQVGLYPNPVVGYEGDEMGIEGSAGQQGVFVGQEIVTGGKLGLRSAVAAHEIVQAEHAWQAQRVRVLNDVRSACYEVLVAQRIVDLNRELVRIGQEGVKAAGDLVAAKEVSRVDLLQARIEADSASLQLFNAQNRHQAAWRRLAALLGTPHMEATPLAGSLESDAPNLTWQEALERLLTESPELAEALAGVERARCAVARERAERIPNLGLRTGVRYHDAAEDTVATIEVGLPLPIFNRNQGNIFKARSELVAAEQEVQRVELALQERLAAVFRRYANARHDAEKYAAEILPNAKASLDMVQSGYRRGVHDYLTLLTAQRTYFQVNLAYLESLLASRSAGVAIEGFLLSGGLERTPDRE